MDFDSFLKAIPDAATSPFAFGAYGIAAIGAVYSGSKVALVWTVTKRIANGQDALEAIRVVTNTVVPQNITAEQWIRSNRTRAATTLAVVLIIATVVIVVVALTKAVPPGNVTNVYPAFIEESVDESGEKETAVWGDGYRRVLSGTGNVAREVAPRVFVEVSKDRWTEKGVQGGRTYAMSELQRLSTPPSDRKQSGSDGQSATSADALDERSSGGAQREVSKTSDISEALCFTEYDPRLLRRAPAVDLVANLGEPVCKFLDSVLEAVQKDFQGFTKHGPVFADGYIPSKVEHGPVSFPICSDRPIENPFVSWGTTVTLEGYGCDVHASTNLPDLRHVQKDEGGFRKNSLLRQKF